MTETNFVGLVNPTYNNAFTMEHTNRSIPHNDLITWSLDHLVTSKPLRGFTMAEILLSLTIIGVVAAITLPSLMANINERTWNTQRKALYARMSQAIAMMPNLNGYGKYSGTNDGAGNVTVTEDTATETFLTEGLSKVLKLNNICDAEHIADCGIPSSLTTMLGSSISTPKNLTQLNPYFTSSIALEGGVIRFNPLAHVNTKAAAFETQNGESILAFYNPVCKSFNGTTGYLYPQQYMCANFLYDLNGNKGPNTLGKDMGFITAVSPFDTVVAAPLPAVASLKTNVPTAVHREAGKVCTQQDADSRLPDVYEAMSMFYNMPLIGYNNASAFWTATPVSSTGAWVIDYNDSVFTFPRTNSLSIHCVKR